MAQTVKKASQSLLRQQQIKLKLFSTAACTWAKTPLRLQVWNLFAAGEQIMRAADCKNLAEKPEGVFRQAQPQQCILLWLLLSYDYHPFGAVFHNFMPFSGINSQEAETKPLR